MNGYGNGSGTFFVELDDLLDKVKAEDQHVDAVSLDLSKAYRVKWRLPILPILKKLNIQGRMVVLHNWKFQVFNAGATFESRLVDNCISQRSVKFFTLFLIAMNSVFERFRAIIVYADDIDLVVFGKYAWAARHRIQNAVDVVVDWT